MHLLLSNDDGYLAPGLRALYDGFRDMGRVTVVAPDRNRSGASNSLTLNEPLRVRTSDDGFHYVDGTPTDCVHLAITGLLDEEPDMVLSGINAGGNLGDDVIYSGTVAAAMEGRFLGFPAIAISLVGDQPVHYETAARVARTLTDMLASRPLSVSGVVLNVNVPDLPWEDIAGFESTRLGFRHKSEPVIRSADPRGEPIFWVGPPGAEQDAGPGTDFHAVRHGRVSVTPIQVDLTQHGSLDNVSGWLRNLS